MDDVVNEGDGRIVGVIGTCSSGGCSRAAARHVELDTAQGRLA
jgi:hypothetical protein